MTKLKTVDLVLPAATEELAKLEENRPAGVNVSRQMIPMSD